MIDSLYIRTPSVDDLQYPPEFGTQDEAILWCQARVDGKSISDWELAWTFAKLAPPDTQHGDETLQFISRELGIDAGSAGRKRWMGSVWTLEIVKRFPRLHFKHYEYGTRLLARALISQNKNMLEEILDLYYQANEGEGNQLGRDDLPRPWTAEKLKKELRQQIEGIVTNDTDRPMPVRGMLVHEKMMDENGDWHHITGIVHENEKVWEQAGVKLTERGLVGQYVVELIKISDSD